MYTNSFIQVYIIGNWQRKAIEYKVLKHLKATTTKFEFSLNEFKAEPDWLKTLKTECETCKNDFCKEIINMKISS